jgi:bifunctional non-homologous end joining protein LigD
MPLEWGEVTRSLNPRDYTIKTAVERMERMSDDPVKPVLTAVPDLAAILGKAMSL